jgi:uncharacterized protein (TIGR03435 family)
MNALANHLWQSTAFAAVAALLALSLRHHRARTRYWIWLAASLKFLLPFTLLTGLGSQVGTHAQLPPIASPKIAARVDAVVVEWGRPPGLPSSDSSSIPSIALIPWAAGALFIATRWTAAWLRIRAMVRSAAPMPIPFPIPVGSTPTSIEPGVFGIFRPVLLLPAGIADRLSPEQLQSVLAHESVHVRRRDNLWAAIHMLVETLFWFHPLVWWIGARLADERERACDEEVLRLGSHPETYAESILVACKLYLESPLPCVSGVTGADLKHRIERIMAERLPRNLTLRAKLLLAAMATIAVIAPIFAGLVRAQAPPSLSFEVASIKPNRSGFMAIRLRQRPGGGLLAENATLRMLIQNAYQIRPHQLIGGPEWINTEHFDVEAKADGANPGQVRLMLRTLLAERFHLKVHRETRQERMYALVVAKGGPKFHDSKGDTSQMTGTGPGTLHAEKIPMTMFAHRLELMLERSVADETGLTSEYDFELKWLPERLAQRPPGDETAPSDDQTSPSLFTALQEQLGLKLETRRGPVEVIVIDGVEKRAEN